MGYRVVVGREAALTIAEVVLDYLSLRELDSKEDKDIALKRVDHLCYELGDVIGSYTDVEAVN